MKPIRIFTCRRLRAPSIILLAAAMNLNEPAQAGSCATAATAFLDTMSSAASRSKFGFLNNECQQFSPPTYYLVDTETLSISVESDSAAGTPPGSTNNQCVTFTDSENGTLNQTDVYVCDKSHASFSDGNWTVPVIHITGFGSATYDNNGTVDSATYSCDSPDDCGWSYPGGGDAPGEVETWLDCDSCTTTPICTKTIDEDDVTGSGSTNYPSDSGCFSWSSWSLVAHIFYHSYSEEYTDGMLLGDLIANMSAYPAGWATNSNSSAYYHISADHASARAGKMKYRIHLTDCVADPNVSYRVHWDEVTTYDNGGTSIKHMQETIPGSADVVNGVVGSTHEIPVPGTPSTVTVTLYNPPELISNGPSGQ